MGRAMELITGFATAPGAAFTAATMCTGNSLTVRDSRRPTRMKARWDTRQAAGASRITSALLHDSTIGMQHGAAIGQTIDTMFIEQMVKPQDLLNLQLTGSAVAGDIEHSSFLLAYDDLPGVSGRFISPEELLRRGLNLFSNTITIATGVTGDYSGQVAVNSAQDSFKANTDYALLGFDVAGADCHVVRYVGPDWGNLGVGGPGKMDIGGMGIHTAKWFAEINMIPVMNSANKALTLIDAAVDENGGNPIVTTHWVELS